MPHPLLRPIANRVRAVQTPVLRRHVLRPASRPLRLPLQPAVVIAPHPDDETLACGGLIAMKRAAGVAVSVIVVTDGTQSKVTPPADPSTLAAQRRVEVLEATRALGVDPHCVHFLSARDGELANLGIAARDALLMRLRRLIFESGAKEIYVPHRHDRHPDHEATYHLTLKAISMESSPDLPEEMSLAEYLVWLVWKRPLLERSLEGLRGAARLDVREVQQLKNHAIAVYRSQLPTMPPGFLPQFMRGDEYFWVRSWTPRTRARHVVNAVSLKED